MARSFQDILDSGKRLLFDGAMGTVLQQRGLGPGESPEEFCLKKPEILESVHRDYLVAGSDVVTTNTFGGTRYKLGSHLDVIDFNRTITRVARSAVENSGRHAFVAGSIGPTGKFLSPLGSAGFEELVKAFQEQVRGLVAGGVDLFIVETQFDIAEARAAVVAIRRESSLPVAVSMTYEEGRTLTGSSVAVCVATLANMGVSLVGMNCSAGPAEMVDSVTELLASSPIPVIVQPNAGLPELKGNATVFSLEPDEFSQRTADFAAKGVQVVGGCCGTTAAHIAALRARIDRLSAVDARPWRSGITLTSRSQLVHIGQGSPICLIGERVNPTGKKVLTAQFQAGEFEEAFRLAGEQVTLGAKVLDVNTGAPMVDEAVLLPDLVSRLAGQYGQPLSLDSSNTQAIVNALGEYPASPLVNSISGEQGRMELLGPLCRDYGAPFILLPLQGSKLPETAKERIAILERLLLQMDTLRIPRHLAMVDVLVLSSSSSPHAAKECLDVIRYCNEVLGLPTTCGLSNISFGLPARELLNSSFFTLAANAGLSSCIANPSSIRMQEALDAVNLLLGHDTGAETFIGKYASWQSTGSTGNGLAGPVSTQASAQASGGATTSGKGTAVACVEDAVIFGRKDLITALVQAALDEGSAPFDIVGQRLIPAITEVGSKYERKEYFLPQLIRAAEAMQTAFALLEPLLKNRSDAERKPVVIMASVEGDIHDIGKNIVSLMLGNHGFDVKDLGKDVPASVIVAAAQESGAVLIGLSALMTTTMVRMEETITLLKEKKLLLPVMVGGAVVTENFARSIGAHYSGNAVDAVRIAQRLLQ